MLSNSYLKNAIAVYESAGEKSKKYGDEALKALKTAEKITSVENKKLFQRKAKRALDASENWRKSAELARNIIEEIQSGSPPENKIK